MVISRPKAAVGRLFPQIRPGPGGTAPLGVVDIDSAIFYRRCFDLIQMLVYFEALTLARHNIAPPFPRTYT